MFSLIQPPNLRWVPKTLTPHGASPSKLARDTIQEKVVCILLMYHTST